MNAFSVRAALLSLLLSGASHALSEQREWRFAVSLDGRPIGFHRFALESHGDERVLISEARFAVKILFFNAYSYEHDSHERWLGDCLQTIDARTNDNGERQVVRGERAEQAFVVTTTKLRASLDACPLTFAYWNARILDAKQLLNPQTGEYVPVRVERLGNETLSVRDAKVAAQRFRLIGQGADGRMTIDLWYSPDMEWLALESTTPDGHRLRYRVQ